MAEGACNDMAQFGAVRLRLAHANLTRTRVAHEACKHLISTISADGAEALHNLLQNETAHFQMISQHIQRWTTRAVQDDWSGYRGDTRKLLYRTRELIGMERRFFFRFYDNLINNIATLWLRALCDRRSAAGDVLRH